MVDPEGVGRDYGNFGVPAEVNSPSAVDLGPWPERRLPLFRNALVGLDKGRTSRQIRAWRSEGGEKMTAYLVCFSVWATIMVACGFPAVALSVIEVGRVLTRVEHVLFAVFATAGVMMLFRGFGAIRARGHYSAAE